MRVNWTHHSRDRQSPLMHLGRFGGGWEWDVGVKAGRLSRERGTVIVSLLVGSLRISWGAR
jgi:hypothetical protein